jgi:2-polyprenyl-6-methoxyphenol hydroxylase-like FAD-dependent oxidoreductase
VVLVGDAAHPVSVSVSGCTGGGLAVTDSTTLTKLVVKHLTLAGINGTGDSEALLGLAREFDEARVEVGKSCMREAREEGGWGRSESEWVRSLAR